MVDQAAEILLELKPYRDAIEGELELRTRPLPGCPPRLAEAMRYSLLAPGKRVNLEVDLIARYCERLLVSDRGDN